MHEWTPRRAASRLLGALFAVAGAASAHSPQDGPHTPQDRPHTPQDQALTPQDGEYRIEVRISLPNVADHGAPMQLRVCLNADDFRSGAAYEVRSDNPLRTCMKTGLQVGSDAVSFAITCGGPNRGFANASFETSGDGFQGSIRMNMGGKNMTMTEIQKAKRIGGCPAR